MRQQLWLEGNTLDDERAMLQVPAGPARWSVQVVGNLSLSSGEVPGLYNTGWEVLSLMMETEALK